jgi:vacuolar-type H+-ATPase subunit E/Vma4
MSLQAILDRIRALGDAQLKEIEKNALSQESEILAQARMEADQIEEDACARTCAPATAERARILHRARLEALHIVGGIREGLVDAALTRTCEHLASLRSDPAYPRVLRSLTEEALAHLSSTEGNEKPRILADPRDRALMEKILQDLQFRVQVAYDLNCQGGLIAQSEDGRVVLINTLEARLQQAAVYLRGHLAAFFAEEIHESEHLETM